MTTENAKRLDKLSVLSKPFQAYLYDCDGTLADNMAEHRKAFLRIALDDGVEIDERIIDELAGWPTVKVVEELNRRYGTRFNPEIFSELKYRLFMEEYVYNTKPVEYVVEHLKKHAGKVKTGVVSGSSRAAVRRTLEVLGIAHLVDVMVCGGDTILGEPNPGPFLTAANFLGVHPSACLVFEDGKEGVMAAIAAGMSWVRIDQVDDLELNDVLAV